jgi:hypothetical protein
MLNIYGILFSQSPDKIGETVMVDGATIKDHMPIESASGNLLGRILSYQIVYRCITEDSIALAGRAGLTSDCPQNDDSNAITGMDYLNLEVPFVKIKGVIIDRIALKEAIKAGNLYFGFHGILKKRVDNIIEKCHIDRVRVRLDPSQNCTKVFLDEAEGA